MVSIKLFVIFVSLIGKSLATPPACFLACTQVIARWCEHNHRDFKCICDNSPSLVGCLVDICPYGSFFSARDHFWGTCLERLSDHPQVNGLDGKDPYYVPKYGFKHFGVGEGYNDDQFLEDEDVEEEEEDYEYDFGDDYDYDEDFDEYDGDYDYADGDKYEDDNKYNEDNSDEYNEPEEKIDDILEPIDTPELEEPIESPELETPINEPGFEEPFIEEPINDTLDEQIPEITPDELLETELNQDLQELKTEDSVIVQGDSVLKDYDGSDIESIYISSEDSDTAAQTLVTNLEEDLKSSIEDPNDRRPISVYNW